MMLKTLMCFMLALDFSLGNSFSGTFDSCQLNCGNHGELPISTPGNPVVGKKGPKGEKGERGRSCDCLNLQNKVNDLESKFNELNDKMNYFTASSCTTIKKLNPSAQDGVYTIYPKIGNIFTTDGISVFCDMTTDGGGWIVIQKRFDGSEDFYRSWEEYVAGFGEKDGEYWIGLENIHQLTTGGNMELRIDLTNFQDVEKFAHYSTFTLGSADTYTLTFGGYSGTAGDAFGYNDGDRHQGSSFSTRDHGPRSGCATSFEGAWWFGACFWCHLNGKYVSASEEREYADGIMWRTWYMSLPLKTSVMKIRAKSSA